MNININVSLKSFLNLGLFILITFVGFKLRNLFIILYISFIISSFIRPIIDWLYKRGIPKSVAMWSIFSIMLITFVVLSSTVISTLINETLKLYEKFPFYIERLDILVSELRMNNRWGKFIPELDSGMLFSLFSKLDVISTLRSATSAFYFLPYVLYVIFMTWNLIVLREEIIGGVLVFIKDKRRRARIKDTIIRIEKILGRWMIGELFLMLIIGLFTFIVLVILGVEYALPLAIIAGVLEVVPNIGPFLALIPASFIALVTGGFFKFILVIVAYILIQQLENNIIVPKVMQIVIGINSFLILISIIAGDMLFGPIGVILAIPTLVIVQISLKSIGSDTS